MGILHECVSVHPVCNTYGGQESVSDTLGLELKVVGSCHVGGMKCELRSSGREASAANH